MIGTLSMDDLSKVRRMSRTDAEGFLAQYHPTVEGMDKLMILELAGKSLKLSDPPQLQRGKVHDSSRSKWFVVAWLMGATWPQLAHLHGIRRQTVMASADTLMISDLRQQARLQQKMSLEALSTYRAAWLAQPEIHKMDPVALAERLLSTTELDK